jgi:uncharacterized membrane-anchored protein YjiN (DUF445 family)
MLATLTTKTVSVKMAQDFVDQTESFARADHKQISEYIRDAIREKNERKMADRIKFLVGKFSVEASALNKEFDVTAGDSLA